VARGRREVDEERMGGEDGEQVEQHAIA